MTIIDITKENAADFEEVLGPDLAVDMGRTFFRGLAAVDDSEVCHGAFVYELLGVDGDGDAKSAIRLLTGDNTEILTQLQEEYKGAIEEDDVKTSYFETTESSLADFYETVGFSKKQGESRQIRLCVSDLEKIPLNRNGKLPGYIQNMEDVSVLQYRNFVKKLLIKGTKGSLEDLAYLPLNWFDRGASCCSISDDKIDGIFLIRKTPSGELHPMLYTAFGPDFLKNLGFMLIHALNYVTENYPPETPIVINRHNKEVLALTQKLLSGYKGVSIFSGTRDE